MTPTLPAIHGRAAVEGGRGGDGDEEVGVRGDGAGERGRFHLRTGIAGVEEGLVDGDGELRRGGEARARRREADVEHILPVGGVLRRVAFPALVEAKLLDERRARVNKHAHAEAIGCVVIVGAVIRVVRPRALLLPVVSLGRQAQDGEGPDRRVERDVEGLRPLLLAVRRRVRGGAVLLEADVADGPSGRRRLGAASCGEVGGDGDVVVKMEGGGSDG
jgi:hypothetical protein